jgi:hypothetical protein
LLHGFAQEERRDGVADRRDQAALQGRAKAQALAVADQPGPDRHLAQHQIQRIARRRSVDGKPQGDRVDAIDDHGPPINVFCWKRAMILA